MTYCVYLIWASCVRANSNQTAWFFWLFFFGPTKASCQASTQFTVNSWIKTKKQKGVHMRAFWPFSLGRLKWIFLNGQCSIFVSELVIGKRRPHWRSRENALKDDVCPEATLLYLTCWQNSLKTALGFDAALLFIPNTMVRMCSVLDQIALGPACSLRSKRLEKVIAAA